MKSMSDFINCMGFRFDKFSVLESFFFEKETDIVSRFFEVFVKIMFSIFSIKNCDFLRSYLKVFNESINLLDSLCALFGGNKVRDNSVSVFSIKI